jgi:hypothetical protein
MELNWPEEALDKREIPQLLLVSLVTLLMK